MELWAEDFPDFDAKLKKEPEEEKPKYQGPTPEQLEAIRKWKEEQKRREELVKAKIRAERARKALADHLG